MKATWIRPADLAIISVCAALNLGVGFVVSSIKLPFYLDSIGTLLATAISGPLGGILTGIVSVLIGSLYTPTLWAYAPTAISVALFTYAAMKFSFLKRFWITCIFGLLLGFTTAVVSAPITAYLWSGVSLSGADAFTAFFLATGKTLLQSVLWGGLSTDPVDKLFTSLIAYAILRRAPYGPFKDKAADE